MLLHRVVALFYLATLSIVALASEPPIKHVFASLSTDEEAALRSNFPAAFYDFGDVYGVGVLDTSQVLDAFEDVPFRKRNVDAFRAATIAMAFHFNQLTTEDRRYVRCIAEIVVRNSGDCALESSKRPNSTALTLRV
jgi:hypothetical protein